MLCTSFSDYAYQAKKNVFPDKNLGIPSLYSWKIVPKGRPYSSVYEDTRTDLIFLPLYFFPLGPQREVSDGAGRKARSRG